MRLIDADEVFCSDCEYKDRCDAVFCDAKIFPTVDAVEVVRCKDCKYCDVGENDAESWIFCKIHIIETYPNDFCSYAERKEQ